MFDIGALTRGKRGKNSYNWKGGKTISRGYIKVYSNGKYVFEHRLIMECYLCRPLEKNEDVHHINGIKTDNRIENLRLFTSRSAHIKHEGNSVWTDERRHKVSETMKRVRRELGPIKNNFGRRGKPVGGYRKTRWVINKIEGLRSKNSVIYVLQKA